MKRHVVTPSLSSLLLLAALSGCVSEEGETTQPLQQDDVMGLPAAGATQGNGGSGGAEEPVAGAAGSESGAGAGGQGAEEEAGEPSAPPEEADGPSVRELLEASEVSDACCAAHDTPGCADPAIEACVCADDVLPQCCTDGWSAACVEIVRQRHCDPGVRECVCTEWEQSSCCDTDWTDSFCDATAELKCGATIGCGE